MEETVYSPHGKDLFPAFSERNIPIFLSTDRKYFPHCLTAIASILANGAKENRYDILVIVHDVDTEDMTVALEWAKRYGNCRIRFIAATECLDLDGMGRFYVTDSFPLAVYFRLFAPTIFANYDKILYLDADLVALADVAELYDQDLGDALVAAVHDFKFESELRDWYSDSGLRFLTNAAFCKVNYQPNDPYFNSGVLVMNLHAMRAEGIQEKFIVATRLVERPLLPDQDVLNLVCLGRVKFVDSAWNFVEWMDEARRAEAKILHFAEKKPWHFRYAGGNRGSYWLYSKMLPAVLHQRVVDALRQQSTIRANIFSFARLLFHLTRSFGLYPFVFEPVQKARYARRKRDYWRETRLLFRHWTNMAALWFPRLFAAFERRAGSIRSGKASSG